MTMSTGSVNRSDGGLWPELLSSRTNVSSSRAASGGSGLLLIAAAGGSHSRSILEWVPSSRGGRKEWGPARASALYKSSFNMGFQAH